MPSTVVGLDIGRTAVRAVELRQRGREATLRRHGSVPLPRGTVESGVVADPDEVTDACRRLWKEGRFSSREVRLGISSGSVLVRQIELDWMPPADLKRALADGVLMGATGVTPNAMRRALHVGDEAIGTISHALAMLRGRMRRAPEAGR